MKSKLKTSKNEKIDYTRKAYNAIRQMLFYNEIHPGQKIKYSNLASRIGMSMTPIIQALKWLEFRNIVRHEANKGYYINEVSLKEITEIYNTRILIEVALITNTMKHLDSTGLEKLKKAHENHKSSADTGNYYKRIMTDMEFHMCLASLADCHIQQNMLQELFDVLLLRYNRNLYFSSVMDTSSGQHFDILQNLEQKNEEGAQKAITYHITSVRDHIVDGMSKLMIDTEDPLSEEFFS
jgi:DNA-binding GntR family transcriptional regulator